MPTPTEIKNIADLLSDPSNESLSAEELAERVLAVVEKFRKRKYKYVVLAQARRGPSQGRAGYFPTWVRGPFYTASEARAAASAERSSLKERGLLVHNKNGDASVMVAEVFEPDVNIDPAQLKEVT